MIAVFLKELRDCGKWGVLAMLVMLGCLAAAVNGGGGGAHAARFEPVLVGQSMNAVTGVGFAVVGLGLGLLVVLPDVRTGRWAFLTHRPIGRGRIFFGKFLAVTALYFLATALPMAMVTAWVVIPGDVAGPFVWQMLLPRLAHLLAGWSAVAAGMLVAARKGRWIGSRLLPAGAAALAWGVVQNFSSAEAVFGVLSAALVLTLLAALAAFVNGGEYESQPGIARLAQGLCLLPGVGIVLLFVMVLPLPIVRNIGMGSETISTSPPSGASDYELANDGHVYQRTGIGGRVVCIDDPHRHVTSYARNNVWAETMGLPFSRIQIPDHNFFDASAYAQQIKAEGQTVWLYLPWQRAVAGYDLARRRYLGSLGPGGFRAPTLAPRPFPQPLEFTSTPGSHVLAMNTQLVWWLNTAEPLAAELAYNAPPGDPIIEVDDWASGDSPPADRRVPIVITRSAVNFIDKGHAIARIPLVRNADEPYRLAYAQVGDGFATLYGYSAGPDHRGPMDYLLVRSDLSGKILSREKLPAYTEASPVETYIPGWDLESHYYILFCQPALAPVVAGFFDYRMTAADWWEIGIIALFSALAAGRLMRRYAGGAASRCGWVVLCLLLGIAGVLLLLCVRTAAARMKCSNCGRKRRVTDERCELCGAAYPTPTRTGVEIFTSPAAVEVGI